MVTTPGKIGKVTIGGALRGLAAAGADGDNSGVIDAAGSIGKVSIGSDIFGGGGTNSGALLSLNKIKSVTVGGSVIGGAGAGSGRISAGGSLARVAIGSGLVGGNGANSGVVHSGGALGNVAVAHDLSAGAGSASGLVSSGATIGTVKITGNIGGDVPDAGARSGGISAAGNIHAIVVSGGVTGGSGILTGFIEGQTNIQTVKITGNVLGGSGLSSGLITAGGTLSSIVVLGTLQGGVGINSGSIFSGTDPNLAGDLHSVKIDGEIVFVQGQVMGVAVVGGDGDASGSIRSGGDLGKVTLGGWSADLQGAALQGGGGDFSGAIYSDGDISAVNVEGAMGGVGDHSGSTTAHGLLKIFTGNIRGGTGLGSGSVRALDSLTIDRDVPGRLGTFIGNAAGGPGALSGAVWSDGSAGKITGVFTAEAGDRSGSITTGAGIAGKGDIDRLAVSLIGTTTNPLSVQLNGAVGTFTISAIAHAAIRVGEAIDSLEVQGNLNDVLITANGRAVQGRQSDLAIARMHIAGDVMSSQILAGYDLEGRPVNPDAQIGPVTVDGNWIASDLVAGVQDVAGDGFGNDDDAAIGAGNPNIISRIASVVIQGAITGSADASDHFGFVAEEIAFFKYNGSVVALDPGTRDVQSLDLQNNDVFLREVQSV